MLYRQKQAILVFEAVNVARYIFFPCFHLLLFWDVDGDLEKIGAGDVFVPLEALVWYFDILFSVVLFTLGLGCVVSHLFI